MKRESGYYWVRLYGAWKIALYSKQDNVFRFSGIMGTYKDYTIDEIDERKIERP